MRLRELVSSLTSRPLPLSTASRLALVGLSEKELLTARSRRDARRTKPPPPSVERLSARPRYLSPLLLIEDECDREGGREGREAKRPVLPLPRAASR